MICSKTIFLETRYPANTKKTLGQMGEGRMDTGIGLCGGSHDGLPFRKYMGAVIWGGVWYLGHTG